MTLDINELERLHTYASAAARISGDQHWRDTATGCRIVKMIVDHLPEIVVRLKAAERAEDLVSLWRAQKISGISRADRNAAIEEVRERLCQSVDAIAAYDKAKG